MSRAKNSLPVRRGGSPVPGRVGDRPAGGWGLAPGCGFPCAQQLPVLCRAPTPCGGRLEVKDVAWVGLGCHRPHKCQQGRRKCSSWWSSFPQQGLGVTAPPALCLWDTQESAGTRGIAPTQHFCPVRCHSWHRAPCPGRPRAITRGHPWIKMLLCGGRSAGLVSHHLRFETSMG